MTAIYVVPNNISNILNYICDSQATIDARPVNKQGQPIIPASQCSVGTQTDADTLLATNQQAWLTQQTSLFTCDLQTIVEGGVVWTVVNLATEPANTTNSYWVLDPTTGQYTEAIGLTAAQALLQQMHQTYLTFTEMASYQTCTAWK